MDSDEGRFPDFALRLRDAAAHGLRSTRYFFTDVDIEDVRLEGPTGDPSLVVLLRTKDDPGHLYGLRAKVSDYHPDRGDASGWAGYIHDQVMEAVDADPGLPEPQGVMTWVDI